MDFLKRNSGKIALLAIIAFFTLPFIYGNEEEEDFSPFAVKSGMSYQANPISKLASKIASFYGFSKPVPQMSASNNRTSSIKDKVSFSKDGSLGPKAKSKTNSKSQEGTLVASARNFKSFDFDNLDSGTSTTQYSGSYSNGYRSSAYAANDNNPVKGYVQVNGQNYAVIEDAKGERYVVTPKGHIPYKELKKRAISQQEFNTKKQLTGANDMEVLRALQQEKARQAYAETTNRQNYQSSSTGYRNGTLSNMGGMNYARVSTSDTGFDDNALSDAYENLRSANLQVDMSSASARGGSSRGGDVASRAITENKDSKTINTDIGLSSQTIASQVKAETRQNLTSKNNKIKEEKPQEKLQEKPQTETQLAAEIIPVKENDEGVYVEQTATNDNEFFIPVKEGESSPYSVWGQVGNYSFDDGEKKHGIIASINIGRGYNLSSSGGDENIKQSVESINSYVSEIENFAFNYLQDRKIYIDESTMDYFSKELLLKRGGLSDFITDKLDEASISLPGPICTPDSFQRFAEEIKKQQMRLDGQEYNPAA